MNTETGYKFPFEKRAYNENCTTEELEAIRHNVFKYNENVLYYKELPIISEFNIKILFDQVEQLGSTFVVPYGLVIDVTESEPPNSRVRRAINKRFSAICESVEHVSFCSGKNILINTAIRFIMYQTHLDSFSIHTTQQAAIEAINKKIHG